MKSYYRLMLGAGSIHANDCFSEEVVGTDFGLTEDLTDKLPEEWRDFNKKFIPTLIQKNPANLESLRVSHVQQSGPSLRA